MNQQTVYTQTDSGLASFFTKIYSLVGMGIGLSALVAALMTTVFRDNMVAIMTNAPWLYMAAGFIELALVFVASSSARKNSPAALPIFLTYSALNGFTLSFIIAQYTGATVLSAFLSSALLFFVMALIGRVTNKDLSGMRKALMAALIGIVLASLVNIFLGSSEMSSGMSFMISIISVVIFSGLIAYDNQMIKNVYYQTGGRVQDGWAISMALSLYLDFINLFLNLLRILGRND